MYSRCAVVFVVLLASMAMVAARSASTSQNAIPQESARSDDSTYAGDFRFLFKVYQECASTDLSSCLKLKLVTAMDRAARSHSNIRLLDGVTFVKDTAQPDETPKSESEIEASLPRALTDREDTLNSMIFERIANFFQTHTLQVKLPTANEIQRSLNGEERGKKKKLGGLLLLPLLLGGTLVPLALGGLALLAGKALIISKLALVLAAIIGLKKLLGGHGGGHESGHEVVVASGGHGSSGWGRSFDQAQNLAYNAYAPQR